MSNKLRINRKKVLIGDPDAQRFRLLESILKNQGAEAEQVVYFSELAQKAALPDRWRYILVAENLPFSPTRRDRFMLQHYFMDLSQRWSQRLGCFGGSGKQPELLGLPFDPVYFALKSSASPETIGEDERTHIAEALAQIEEAEPLLPSLPHPVKSQAYGRFPGFESTSLKTPDFKSMLAEISSLNDSIAADWGEIEKLKQEKQDSLAALERAMEGIG
jgi:hypothetical protein